MGRFIFVSFGLLVVFLSLSGTAADCPPDWSSYEGHCYRFFKKWMDWDDAEEFCTQQQTGGHLVSFQSREEANFVRSLTSPILKADVVWIGLGDVWNKCRFEWTDGMEFDYADYYFIAEYECVASKPTDNKWWIIPCTRRENFVCEFQA
uniref:BATXCTL8 n=1 Tax=Bothrops atrox TaxID=8725 RepID=A0A1L8D6H8_BOTAT